MLRTSTLSLALLLMLLASACSSVTVNFDYDPEEDYSVLQSYAWLPEESAISDTRTNNDLVANRIRGAMESTLAARGYTKSDGTPDFYITYHILTDKKLQARTINSYYGHYGYGYGYGVGMGGGDTYITEYEVGTLVIDIADAKKKELIWRGNGSSRLSSSPTPEKTTKLINEVVTAILEKFPPEVKAK